MAFTGRPALEAVDENTGLDAWAAKALDGLALTPTPAVQQEVSQDPFTDRALSRAQRRRARDAESPRRRLVDINGDRIKTGAAAMCVRSTGAFRLR